MADLHRSGDIALASFRLPPNPARELREQLQDDVYGVRIVDAENATVGVCVPLSVYQLLFQLACTVSNPAEIVKLFDLGGSEEAVQDGDVPIGELFKR